MCSRQSAPVESTVLDRVSEPGLLIPKRTIDLEASDLRESKAVSGWPSHSRQLLGTNLRSSTSIATHQVVK